MKIIWKNGLNNNKIILSDQNNEPHELYYIKRYWESGYVNVMSGDEGG